MTLPDERYRAINRAREFLRDLMDPSKTKRIPKAIRREAYYVLKHYPWEMYVDDLAEASPEILQKPKGKE